MRILVLGEPGVGKSTLVQRVAEKCEDRRYRMFFQAGDEPQTSKLVEVELLECKSATLDSSVVGVIYVIDTTDRNSFEQIKEVHVPAHTVPGHRSKDLTLLISTKTDLQEMRKVSTEEVEEFAACQSLLTFECNIHTARSYDVVSRMIRMKLPIKHLVQVRKYQAKSAHFNNHSSEKRPSMGEPMTPLNKFSFDSHAGATASTQLPSQIFNYPNSLPPALSSPFPGNQRLLRSGSRDQLKLLTEEKSGRWNQFLRDNDETSDYRLNLEHSMIGGTQRDHQNMVQDILATSPMRGGAHQEEDYRFLETGISQVLIRPTDIGGGKHPRDLLSDSEILRKMDEDIAQMSMLAGRRQHAQQANLEEPYMILHPGEGKKVPAPAKTTEYDTDTPEPSPLRQKHFESFKSSNGQPQSYNSSSKQCLMKVIINKTDVSVFADDNSESVTRRYFDKVGTLPLKRDFLRLQALVKEKIEKKIEYLAVMFKRPLARLEQQLQPASKPKSVSIDLSNKENRPPNIPTASPKPSAAGVRTGTHSAAGRQSSQEIPIAIKKDDDPEQLARVVLIQRGLGLARVAELADMIRRNQQRLFGARAGRPHK